MTFERLRYQHTNGPLAVTLTEQPELGSKPIGLWYSVGTEWKNWCIAAEFATERLRYVYRVTIDMSRILRLTTTDEILDFTMKFAAGSSYSIYRDTAFDIDWNKVAERWGGIEIAPYQWDLRLDRRTTWYYGWDVASGCLWEPEALAGWEISEEAQ